MPSLDRRAFVSGSLATVAMSGLSGCTGSPFGGTDYERIIGAPTPQSGPLATAGQAGLRGMKVGIDAVNNSSGEDVSLELKDGEGAPKPARNVVQESISNNVPAVTGTFSSDVSIALSNLAESEEFPFMTAISGAPEVTDEGDEFTFRMAANTYQQCKGTMEYWKAEGIENIAVLAADYSYGQSVLNYIKEYASAYGQSLQYSTLIPLNTSSFTPALRQIPTKEINGVLFAFPGGNGPTLVSQARQQGMFDAVENVLGFNSYGTVVFKQALEKEITGLRTWSVALDDERAKKATDMMLERFGVRMDALSLPNFDAVTLISRAMEAADELTPSGIRNAIADTDYHAASGYDVRFNEKGENTKYRMVIGQWEEVDGGIVNVPKYQTKPLAPTKEPQ